MDSSEATDSASDASSQRPLSLRCLEFYSGIGGMHFALDKACELASKQNTSIQPQVVQAFDINTIANRVYETNFGHKVSPKTILSLTQKDLDKYAAMDLWLLSPPCQPYTRQGQQKDIEDPRAESFLHLLKLLPTLNVKPRRLLIENVVGFEVSETRKLLMKTLQAMHYRIEEFHLSPDHIGIPNSRMRYFCLAALSTPASSLELSTEDNIPTRLLSSIPRSSQVLESDAAPSSTAVRPLKEYLEVHRPGSEEEKAFLQRYLVPSSVILKSGYSFDIAFADEARSCCFTKNYGRLVEGAGSVIQTVKEAKGIPGDPESLRCLGLRYFSPREIANIHGFPSSFKFADATDKQSYNLLGNSLNVSLVADLLVYLLSWKLEQG